MGWACAGGGSCGQRAWLGHLPQDREHSCRHSANVQQAPDQSVSRAPRPLRLRPHPAHLSSPSTPKPAHRSMPGGRSRISMLRWGQALSARERARGGRSASQPSVQRAWSKAPSGVAAATRPGDLTRPSKPVRGPHLEACHAQHTVAVVRKLRRVGVHRAAARLQALALSGAALAEEAAAAWGQRGDPRRATRGSEATDGDCNVPTRPRRTAPGAINARSRARAPTQPQARPPIASRACAPTHLVAVVSPTRAAADALAGA